MNKTALIAAALGLALGAASAAHAEAGGIRDTAAPAATATDGATPLAQERRPARADPDHATPPGTPGWLRATDACLALAAVGALVLLGRRRGFE